MSELLPNQDVSFQSGEAIRTPEMHVDNVRRHRTRAIYRSDYSRSRQGCREYGHHSAAGRTMSDVRLSNRMREVTATMH